ncbi:hypothetical protein KEF85_08905 [Methylomonas paludis]|uniref:Uncharacterized protein n=1 Tax=Methylomonas paludis TaxID=1173101 RepID=A0A975R8U6_9GAMM|nr:hypothetical protein [Methylomonas paludis]QWF69501.1 hypothetical protein KEF85_08905 [Methylomonas paludis]
MKLSLCAISCRVFSLHAQAGRDGKTPNTLKSFGGLPSGEATLADTNGKSSLNEDQASNRQMHCSLVLQKLYLRYIVDAIFCLKNILNLSQSTSSPL